MEEERIVLRLQKALIQKKKVFMRKGVKELKEVIKKNKIRYEFVYSHNGYKAREADRLLHFIKRGQIIVQSLKYFDFKY